MRNEDVAKLGKYKHGKQTKPIVFEEFKNAMVHGVFHKENHKSFLAFLYWFGVRKAEALERNPLDFSLKDDKLVVHCPAKKGGIREDLEIDLDLPYVDLILRDVKKALKKKKERVWNFGPRTAIYIIKRALGKKYYPHFLRLNRATHFLEDSSTTIPEMKAWFGWRESKSIEPYIGFSRRHIHKQSERLRREFES